jgi:chromosome segregation ATPase
MVKPSGRYAKGSRSTKALAQARTLASAEEQVAALTCKVDELLEENSALKAYCAFADVTLKTAEDRANARNEKMKMMQLALDQSQQENNALKAATNIKADENNALKATSEQMKIKADQMKIKADQMKIALDQFHKANSTLVAKCEALQQKYAALVGKRVASVPLSWGDI